MHRPVSFLLRRLRPGLGLLLALAAARAETPWFDLLYGRKELFPSMLLALADDSEHLPRDPEQKGDPTGVIAVHVTNPAPDTPVTVTLSETALFAESTVTWTLPEAGKAYFVAPIVRWNYERLATIKQPIANFVIRALVRVGNERHEIYARLVVRSVNDWLRAYVPRGAPPTIRFWDYRTRYLLAAYVNENSALIDREITKLAQEKKPVISFRGYFRQSEKDKVDSVNPEELKAVYESLRTLGFRYTAMSEPSYTSHREVDHARVLAQNVRLFGDAFAARQANATEGAAILAAVYRKLGLHVVIMFYVDAEKAGGQSQSRLRPLLGVYSTRDGSGADSLVVIDPELIGSAAYEAAVKSGQKAFEANRTKLVPVPPGQPGHLAWLTAQQSGNIWISLSAVREAGVLPIPELEPAPVAR